MRLVAALDDTLAEAGVPVTVKLLRCLNWLALVEKAPDEAIAGRVAEFLDFARRAAAQSVPEESSLPPAEPPSGAARKMFHMLTAQYARKDTVLNLNAGLVGRWKCLWRRCDFRAAAASPPPCRKSSAKCRSRRSKSRLASRPPARNSGRATSASRSKACIFAARPITACRSSRASGASR